MKRLLFCLLILLSFVPLHSLAQKYISPAPGEFPIIASTVFNSETGPRPGDLADVKDCGFNLCMEYTTVERFSKLLQYMEGTGLRLLIQAAPFIYYPSDNSSDWKKTLPEFVARFKDNPNVAGWKFCDEPKWTALGEIRKRYDLLHECDSTKLIYINLVGEIQEDFTGPCRNLAQYLDSIQTRLPLEVCSFDYYPIMIRRGVFQVNYQGFYSALDAFSEKSRQTGAPMWSYLDSMGYIANAHTRPEATEPYLSFAAFSSLAYGAQGILYWTYWQRPSGPKVEHLPALVDLEGNKTKAWYAARKVNHQIRALTPVFLGAEMVEVRHTGMIGMDGTYPFINNWGPLETLTNDVKGVLVSQLKNGERKFLVIVNHDVEKKQKVKMKFRKDLAVTRLVTSDTGKLSTQKVKANSSITLTPGGYAVFEY